MNRSYMTAEPARNSVRRELLNDAQASYLSLECLLSTVWTQRDEQVAIPKQGDKRFCSVEAQEVCKWVVWSN